MDPVHVTLAFTMCLKLLYLRPAAQMISFRSISSLVPSKIILLDGLHW